jgi:hypothetical protein
VKELSLRERVKEIRESDPAFFEEMAFWKEDFKERRKSFWDKRIVVKKRDVLTKKVSNYTFTVDDAVEMIKDRYFGDEDLVLA